MMPSDTEKPDTLTLTVRLHDPKEKQDAAKSTAWSITEVPRAALEMTVEQFVETYMLPAFRPVLDQLKPKS